MGVGGHDPVLAGERADQHQQRAFRQVEIGDHRIDAADAVAGEDEDLRLAGERLQFAVPHGGLQRAHDRGAHRYHAAAAGARCAHLLDQCRTDVEPFAVHAVFVDVVHAHRLERTGTDMQRHVAEFDAAVAQRGKQRIVEVQARGRRRDRAQFAREHGLVALVVVLPGRTLYVGRQRQAPDLLQPAFQRIRDVEAQLVELAVAADHFRLAAGIQVNAAARLGRLAGAHLRPRGVLRQQALDQDLHAAAAFLLPEQARRNHAGVVENQQIARLQPFGQVADVAIRERRVARRHHQQAAGGTLRQRRLGDQRLGQVEMEIGLLHGRGLAGACIVRDRPARPGAAQRSNLVDSTMDEVVRSTPSSAPMRSVSRSMSPTLGTAPMAIRS